VHALSDNSEHTQFINKSFKWISELKVMAGKKDISKTIKCLRSWLISLNAIKKLWLILRDDYGFQFLFTRRLSQDPLEHLFSVVRLKGGN
jgi:hypothetical protein